jgi:heme-degrading monooxygenase HmoA
MWAQLVKMRATPEYEGQFKQFESDWEEQVGRADGSGWVRTLAFQAANDPSEYYIIAFFESEEKARANETNPKHQELIGRMATRLQGEPEYVDLTPLHEGNR